MKMSKEDVKVKMSSGERNPLEVKISQENVEKGDAKVELRETHFKRKKVAQCFSLGFQQVVFVSLVRYLGGETSSKTAVGDKAKTRARILFRNLFTRRNYCVCFFKHIFK